VPNAWPSVDRVFRDQSALLTPGFLGRFVTRDVNDPDSMYAIAFWEDIASVERWLASDAYRLGLSSALRPFLAGSQSVSMGEVRLEDVGGWIARLDSTRDRGSATVGTGSERNGR